MLVEVTNFPSAGKLAEDAHQAELNITVPEALTYKGVRSSVRPLGTGDLSFSSYKPYATFVLGHHLCICLYMKNYFVIFGIFKS